MEQKVIETIGYADSYPEFRFRHSKVFVLQVFSYDTAGAVPSNSCRGPGYCHKLGRGPKSGVIGHATGLPFFLYVKSFQPPIFKTVNL